MTTARRRARVGAARAAAAVPVSFDWRDPLYGIERWPPGPDNPVTIDAIQAAKRRAREARQQAAQ